MKNLSTWRICLRRFYRLKAFSKVDQYQYFYNFVNILLMRYLNMLRAYPPSLHQKMASSLTSHSLQFQPETVGAASLLGSIFFPIHPFLYMHLCLPVLKCSSGYIIQCKMKLILGHIRNSFSQSFMWACRCT